MEPRRRDLSMVRFFNSYDLSDCTLEIIEDDADEITAKRNCVVDSILIKTENCREHGTSGGPDIIKCEDGVSCLMNAPKKQRMDYLFINKQENETKKEKTVLYIHSLLFCSNSEYFQKLLMTSSRQQNIRMLLKSGETAYFIKLIKLFYDESQISNMPLIDTVYVLKFAKRYSCINLTSKLIEHISTCKINSIRTLNQSVRIYYNLIDSECENMHEVIIRMKTSCLKYLKTRFCPVEKIFGTLLNEFLELSFDALYFLLDNVDAGIAVTEDNVIALVMYWIVSSDTQMLEKRSLLPAAKLLNKCYTEHVASTFIMDVLSRPHDVIYRCSSYQQYYLHSLEKFVIPNPENYFPQYQSRAKRTRNFAFDHEVLFYFAPNSLEYKNGEGDTSLISLSTEHKNILFVRGYQLTLSAGIFQVQNDKELRVKFTVENVNRIPHSKLFFSMLYAVNSPSVSEYFSPWNHCIVMIDSNVTSGWAMVSLIAEHSLIKETGFYLKFYIE